MSWQTVKRPDQSVIHIIPMNDLEPHKESAECRCEPVLEYIDDGFCDLLVHQPYDDSLLITADCLICRQPNSSDVSFL